MKPKLTFIIGANAFFKGMPDFEPHDIDKLCLMDSWGIPGTNVLNMKKGGEDVFFFKDMTKDEFIADALNSGVPMRVGKFLVREFAEHLKMTIGDLARLAPLIDRLDDRHEYERVIYAAYIENGAFELSEKQLNEAYNTYKKWR